MHEDQLLDDEFQRSKPPEKKASFNYVKYSFSYLFLMIAVSFFLHKYQQRWESEIMKNFMNAYFLISMSVVFAFLREGLSLFYWSAFSEKKRLKVKHPFWFRVLELSFYCWCVLAITLMVYYFAKR